MKPPRKPKTHVIRPIDIKPGMFVFVSKWYEEHAKKDEEVARDMWGKPTPAAKKPVGDPLKVLAVAPPFITVQILGNGNCGVMDTREVEFTKCGLEWVKSLIPQYDERLTDLQKTEQDGGRKRLQYVAKDGGFWREITERSKD